MRADTIHHQLRPLDACDLQVHLGTGLHVLGLLSWILKQTGPAEVCVSTFSTSEEFLSGFLNLRKKGLITRSVLVADLKASRMTVRLGSLMDSCFDRVCLAQNHSKVVLVLSATGRTVSVVTSQNQTYGGRAECTVVSTSQTFYYDLYCGFRAIAEKGVSTDGLFNRTTEGDRAPGLPADAGIGDLLPPGAGE